MTKHIKIFIVVLLMFFIPAVLTNLFLVHSGFGIGISIAMAVLFLLNEKKRNKAKVM